jgi:hypothetical protein
VEETFCVRRRFVKETFCYGDVVCRDVLYGDVLSRRRFAEETFRRGDVLYGRRIRYMLVVLKNKKVSFKRNTDEIMVLYNNARSFLFFF